MWGGKPVDASAVLVCWICGHRWPRESAASESGALEAAESADDDRVRCRRCNRTKPAENRGSEAASDAR